MPRSPLKTPDVNHARGDATHDRGDRLRIRYRASARRLTSGRPPVASVRRLRSKHWTSLRRLTALLWLKRFMLVMVRFTRAAARPYVQIGAVRPIRAERRQRRRWSWRHPRFPSSRPPRPYPSSPTRVRGVHLDLRILQLVGELHGVGVDCGLRDVVGRRVSYFRKPANRAWRGTRSIRECSRD